MVYGNQGTWALGYPDTRVSVSRRRSRRVPGGGPESVYFLETVVPRMVMVMMMVISHKLTLPEIPRVVTKTRCKL